jgi:hypothetical protein
MAFKGALVSIQAPLPSSRRVRLGASSPIPLLSTTAMESKLKVRGSRFQCVNRDVTFALTASQRVEGCDVLVRLLRRIVVTRLAQALMLNPFSSSWSGG